MSREGRCRNDRTQIPNGPRRNALSKLGMINAFGLQWLGIRLYKSVTPTGEVTGWGLLIGILPLSGWRSEYIGPGWKLKLTGD